MPVKKAPCGGYTERAAARDVHDEHLGFLGPQRSVLNCTMKRSPEMSHTDGLIGISKAIMEKNGITVEVLRPTTTSPPASIPT